MYDANKFFRHSPYNIIRLLLMFSGLWPFYTTTRRYATYLGFLLVLGSGLIFEMLGVIENWSNTEEVLENLPQLLLGIVTVLKLICAIYSLPEIKKVLTRMQDYWYSPKSDEETRILQSYALYGRNLGYIYTSALLTVAVTYCTVSLLSKFIPTQSMANETSSNVHGKQGLPHLANYIVDMDTYFVPIYIHTVVCNISDTVMTITFDVLYVTLVQHCCGLFDGLRYRLENAVEYGNDNDSAALISTEDISLSNTVYSIRRHTDAIKFASLTDSIYKLLLFLHLFGFTLFLLGLLGYQMMTSTEEINNLLKPACFFVALFFNTFFGNWQGQKIMNSSEKVYESAYNTRWYMMPANQRKLFIMIMMRSKEPSKITAGKFAIMSYTNFSAVIRTSWSYCMLLRST